MSWDKSYVHTLAYSLDIGCACVFWNTPDVTVSGMCRVVQLSDADGGNGLWGSHLESLKLWKWQVSVLRWLAPILDKIQANHCEGARQADLARAARITALLS